MCLRIASPAIHVYPVADPASANRPLHERRMLRVVCFACNVKKGNGKSAA